MTGHGIPRRLHFVWAGDDPIPPERQRCIDSCIAHHPGWEVSVWTSVEQFGLLHNRRAFYGADDLAPASWPHSRYQIMSNVLRFEVMLRYGGLFFDTDIVCLRSLEPLVERVEAGGKAGMLGWEIQSRWLGEAVIAAVPGAPFMQKIVSNLERWAFAHKGRPATVTVGPQYITPLLKHSVELADVLVMPQRAFFPARFDQPELSQAMADGTTPAPGSYAVHCFFNNRRKRGMAPL